jgi:hypothetical protein
MNFWLQQQVDLLKNVGDHVLQPVLNYTAASSKGDLEAGVSL